MKLGPKAAATALTVSAALALTAVAAALQTPARPPALPRH